MTAESECGRISVGMVGRIVFLVVAVVVAIVVAVAVIDSVIAWRPTTLVDPVLPTVEAALALLGGTWWLWNERTRANAG